MLRTSFDFHDVSGIELGKIDFFPANEKRHAFWSRHLTFHGEGGGVAVLTLFTHDGEESLMTEDEKMAKVKEDGSADLRLERLVHPEDGPAGVARIAGDGYEYPRVLPDGSDPFNP